MGIETKIDQILKTDWDPIGVGHDPDAADEYHRYVYELIVLLSNKTSEADLVAYLKSAEEYIGLPSQPDNKLASIAQKLISLRLPTQT